MGEPLAVWAEKACLEMAGAEYESLGQIAQKHGIFIAGNAYELDSNFPGLVVLNDRKLSPEQELVQDMLSIINCFSSRLYGLRKYKSTIKEELQKETTTQGIDKAVTEQCIENQAIS